MTIREAEDKTGLTRSNIRFYEKEGLIAPSRNKGNGYRDYSEEDVEQIRKIAFLRTLGVSIEDIRALAQGEKELAPVLEEREKKMAGQITELAAAKKLCRQILRTKDPSFASLRIENYTSDVSGYWKNNRKIFRIDSAGFLSLWGSFMVWAVLTVLCLLISIFSYPGLPSRIPIQWSGGVVSSSAGKIFIFLYPAACFLIRFLLRPVLYGKFINELYGRMITEYLSNFLCFAALSVELFTLLYLHGLMKSIAAVLAVDAAVFLGLFAAGMSKINRMGER